MKTWSLLLGGAFLVLAPKALPAYIQMPFPGSQELESITVVYYLRRIVPMLQLAGALMAAMGVIGLVPQPDRDHCLCRNRADRQRNARYALLSSQH